MIVSALLTSVGINTALCVLFFILYSVLRKQPGNYEVYMPELVREDQRRLREEARAEKRDALIAALLNKLSRDDMNDETSADVNYEFSIFKKSGEPRGHYESINLSHEEYCQAMMYVLQNCEEVWPFIEEHMSELEVQGSQSQCKGFPDWFRSRVGVLSKQGHVSLTSEVYQLVHLSWLVVVKMNPCDLFNMPIDKDNDVSGVNDVMVDEVAYQQLVVHLNIDNPTRVEPNFIMNLY
ncbi:hypothetical protein K1719_042578 [Acacia pycnantha]|nr:hypothetical protein K1719_042578 [Acacia pycnantha]